jgi:peptidyl-prolyl cis-trans isomerase C
MKKNNNMAKLILAVVAVSLLGGCKPVMDFFKNKRVAKKVESNKLPKSYADNSPVLLNIDGMPAITENDFNKHLTQMLQVNPYFRGASLDSLPGQLKRKFFEELVKQELILAWANKNNVDQDADFRKNYEEMKKLVKRSLLVQNFETKLFEDVKVLDADVKDHFEKNKDKFVKEPGGVNVEGISFEDNEAANTFLALVKGKEAEFKTLAKAQDKDAFKSFGRIEDKQASMGSFVPKEIKDKALSLKKYPSVVKVQSGGKVWVICATDKKDTQYFELAEIKEQLEGMLKNNKFREILEEKVKDLKGDFTLDINEDFFSEPAPAMEQETPASSAA